MSISLPVNRLHVVLVGTRNPLNIGAAARAMSNFGVPSLRVVRPFEPSFREARSAVGAAELLNNAEEFSTVAEAVADCALVVGTTAIRHRALQHPVKTLPQGSPLIRRRLRIGPVALLFGSEKFGLSNEDLSHCHWLIRISTSEANISMNLGQAVAVCLYEITRDARVSSTVDRKGRASAGEMERITTVLMEALKTSGFLSLRRVADSEERIRRVVRRMNLPSRDADVWLGMLRQMLWKMRQTSPSGKHRPDEE